MLAEVLAGAGIRILGDLPPDGRRFWAGRFWDRAGAENDAVLGEDYRQERRDLVALIERFGAQASTVVEVCTGTGEFLTVVLDGHPDRSYLGLDISESALREAAKRVPTGATAKLVCGDVWADDLAIEPADLVLCIDSMQHLGNTGAVLDRLASFVTPGGVLIGNVWTRDNYHELERLRYGRWGHLRRSASFLVSAVLIRASGGRLRSDHYRTKLVSRAEIERRLRTTFTEVLDVTHHRYHTAFAVRP